MTEFPTSSSYATSVAYVAVVNAEENLKYNLGS